MMQKLLLELKKAGSPQRAKASMWFFKTGKGEYGEGDKFLGLTVPQQRLIAAKYTNLALSQIQRLLNSKVHEHRFTAMIILVTKFKHADKVGKKQIFQFYLKNAKKVNNWDLVDTSAPYIVGEYLLDKNKAVLHKLARSKNLWEKRISVLSTFAFIRRSKFEDSLKIARILLSDEHDLIHKAVGWMLREIGKRSLAAEEIYLLKHYRQMPRTMLRYAIERLSGQKKRFYLK